MGIMLLCINTLIVLTFCPLPNIPPKFIVFEGPNNEFILT